jgi:hypothetical protein
MQPQKTVESSNIQRFIQLPPRILQEAKLDFRYVNVENQSTEIRAEQDNPIAGWVLINHLDQALNVFAPDGKYLGEMYISVDNTGNKKPTWHVLDNDNRYKDIANVTKDYSLLGNFLENLQTKTETDFNALTKAIDETLWSIDMLGERKDKNLSVFIGRPLALVKASLQFLLKGDAPVSDPSWIYTFPDVNKPETIQAPVLPEYTFKVRLGDLATRDDGLLGYFTNDNYNVFYSTQESHSSEYVQPIGV